MSYTTITPNGLKYYFFVVCSQTYDVPVELNEGVSDRTEAVAEVAGEKLIKYEPGWRHLQT